MLLTAAVTTMWQPPLRAVPMNLFPVMGSLQEVMDLAESQLPITNKNQLVALLGCYHNTLLAEVAREVRSLRP
jgi:hypothetical protein